MSILLLLFFVLLIYFIESHPPCMAATPGHQEPFPFHICRKKHLVIIVILLRMWLSITRFVITILPLSLGILHKSMLRTNDGLFVRLIPSSPGNLIIYIRSHIYLYVINIFCEKTTVLAEKVFHPAAGEAQLKFLSHVKFILSSWIVNSSFVIKSFKKTLLWQRPNVYLAIVTSWNFTE